MAPTQMPHCYFTQLTSVDDATDAVNDVRAFNAFTHAFPKKYRMEEIQEQGVFVSYHSSLWFEVKNVTSLTRANCTFEWLRANGRCTWYGTSERPTKFFTEGFAVSEWLPFNVLPKHAAKHIPNYTKTKISFVAEGCCLEDDEDMMVTIRSPDMPPQMFTPGTRVVTRELSGIFDFGDVPIQASKLNGLYGDVIKVVGEDALCSFETRGSAVLKTLVNSPLATIEVPLKCLGISMLLKDRDAFQAKLLALTNKPGAEKEAAKALRRKEVEKNVAEALQKRKREKYLKLWRLAVRQVVRDNANAKPVVTLPPKGKKVVSEEAETRVYVTKTSKKKKNRTKVPDAVVEAKREMTKEISIAAAAKHKAALAERRLETEAEEEARSVARRVAKEIGGW